MFKTGFGSGGGNNGGGSGGGIGGLVTPAGAIGTGPRDMRNGRPFGRI